MDDGYWTSRNHQFWPILNATHQASGGGCLRVWRSMATRAVPRTLSQYQKAGLRGQTLEFATDVSANAVTSAPSVLRPPSRLLAPALLMRASPTWAALPRASCIYALFGTDPQITRRPLVNHGLCALRCGVLCLLLACGEDVQDRPAAPGLATRSADGARLGQRAYVPDVVSPAQVRLIMPPFSSRGGLTDRPIGWQNGPGNTGISTP
jgi:hypothetical protein